MAVSKNKDEVVHYVTMSLLNSGLAPEKNTSRIEGFPSFHIFYENREVDCADDKPKYMNLPESYGGSGELFKDT